MLWPERYHLSRIHHNHDYHRQRYFHCFFDYPTHLAFMLICLLACLPMSLVFLWFYVARFLLLIPPAVFAYYRYPATSVPLFFFSPLKKKQQKW
ncbi:hypothetical protein BDZ91DRAFT_135886 [Kalaharituber pfeilii]|nr:hypothetical protein BDZ91DRAFT_135886 [Kalaharituber pfeilii]